jgi:hypothetical protein
VSGRRYALTTEWRIMRAAGSKMQAPTSRRRLCCDSLGDCLPDLEAWDHLLSVYAGRKQVTARADVWGNGIIRGQEPRRMTRRCAPLHVSLPLLSGLVRVLRTGSA